MSLTIEKGKDLESRQAEPTPTQPPHKAAVKLTFLIFSCLILAIGNTAGPLLLRLYFIRGGARKWLSSWLETAGWPMVLIPLSLSYLQRKKNDPNAKLFSLSPRLFGAAAILGLLTGADDFMYAYGTAYLPVSTSALLISTQLVFNAVFAIPLVKQKFTPYSINAIFLLTLGAVVLGIHSKGDRPPGTSSAQYVVGFLMTIGAAALYGFVLPLTELVYLKAKRTITPNLVIEVQMVVCIFATALCTVGMLVNHDFEVISREAREYELGQAKYYVVLVGSAISWQLFFMGMVGVIASSSSLHAGVLITAMMPVTETLAVVFFHEEFKAEKGISLALCLWGFASYFYGEFKKKQQERDQKEQLVETHLP